jgi:REP element-mobilizing transposase RayT
VDGVRSGSRFTYRGRGQVRFSVYIPLICCYHRAMSRPLRVEFSGAIYHVMCRGNGRQQIFHDDGDYQRLLDGLPVAVNRYGWELFSFVMMPNHFHLFLRTPQPNLSRGMQYLSSGYTNWYAKRHRRHGHLLQRRFGTPARPKVYAATVNAVPLPIPPNTRVCDGRAHRPTPSSGRVAARRRG